MYIQCCSQCCLLTCSWVVEDTVYKLNDFSHSLLQLFSNKKEDKPIYRTNPYKLDVWELCGNYFYQISL